MGTLVKTRLAWPFALGTALIVAVASILYRNALEVGEDTRLVAHTHDVIGQLERTLSTVKDAETGQRGFLLTGEERYLEPYNSAIAQVGRDLERLRVLTADNAEQQGRIASIESQVAARLDGLAENIALRRDEGPEAARQSVLNGRGKAVMDELRRMVREMADEEERLLDLRERASQSALGSIKLAYLASLLGSLGVLAALYWALARYFRVRDRAEAAVREQREWLAVTLASIGDAVIATDALGRVTFINPVAQALSGWTTEEAVGRPLPEVFRIVNETTRAVVENPVEKVLACGHVVGLANHTVLIARDGAECPIEDSAAPIAGRDGRIAGVILVFHDVSERRGAEKELAASEEFNRRVVASSPDCLKVLGLDGRLLSMNENGCRLMEVDDLASHLDREWAGSWPEGGRGQVLEALAAARAGRVANFRGQAPTAKGAWKWWDVSVSPIFDAAGEPAQILTVSRDITEKMAAEASLREGEERLRLIMENVSDHAIFTISVEGEVTDWNAGAEEVFGYGKEIIGRPAAILFTPEDRESGRPEREMELARIAGRASDNRWHIRADGTRFFAAGSMESLRGEDGTLRGFVKVVRDQTEQKRAEDAREQRAGQLQRLAEISARINAAHDVNSVVGVVTEEARRLIGARQAATSMVFDPSFPQPRNAASGAPEAAGEAATDVDDGRRLREIVEQEDRPIRLTRDDLTTDPRLGMFEGVALVKPGENGWLAAPLVGRNGKGIGLLQLADKEGGEFTEDDEAMLVQLSRIAAIAVENARLYEELRADDERKDEFLAMLAHELRNPLAAISNAVQLSTKTEVKEDRDWSLEVITRQMLHLSRLIDDLMDVSRITRGKIELRSQVLDATPILRSAAATVGPLVEERKHTLDIDIADDPLWVAADPTRLEQVVVNLLNNAAKYSENGGHIRLSARRDGDQVVVSIKDKGVGIAPEKLPEMFELFAQGDRSLARSEGGLGIGLTVVKKLVEMHGGTISATSEGPGLGSEFAIRLPLGEGSAAGGPIATKSDEPPVREAKILVVDDNVDTARGMSRILKLLGHEVAVAHGGHEAIETARAFRPEFILLDIGLPGMSGYEVAARLRGEACCKDTLIVAVSGYGQDEDRRRSKEAGFDHHLTKPLDHQALLELLAAE